MLDNLGGPEILILAMIAILLVGPKRLPDVMRSVGRAMRTFREETKKATDMLKAGLDDVDPTKPIAAPGPGVVDVPDGMTVATVEQIAPPKPPAPPPPPPSDHEVRPVVRDYEDT